MRHFSGHDPRAILLQVNCPFHTSILEPARNELDEFIKSVPLNSSIQMDLISNVTGRPYPTQSGDETAKLKEWKNLIVQQAIVPVCWSESVKYLEDQGVRTWISVGPGDVGKNLVGKDIGMDKVFGLSKVSDLEPIAKLLS